MYAIKRTIRGVKRQSPEFAQYLQEVQILSNVPYHPGIIRYYASWTEPSTDMYDTEKLFIQLEAGSSTLKNLSLGDPLPDKVLRSVALQVLEGLEHLHTHGIAHMDIKPSNILIVRSEGREMIDETDMFSFEDGEIKLGDFGLATGCRYATTVTDVGFSHMRSFVFARICILSLGHHVPVSHLTAPTRLSSDTQHRRRPLKGNETQQMAVQEGDACYLPLEVMNSNYSQLDKADVFALGATLFELASGNELPSGGQLYEDLRRDKVPLLPNMTTSMMQMIRSMMRFDPAERPSASQLLTRLRRGGSASMK